MIRKRWISVWAENEMGVLARIASLFAGKSYNLDSLTIGITEDTTIARMTISFTSDDQRFEQIKKQISRSVEVLKVLDFTNTAVCLKELMFVKISGCTEQDKTEITEIINDFEAKMIDCDMNTVLFECVQTNHKNDDLIRLLKKSVANRMEIVRSGSVAIEAKADDKCS